MNTSLSPKDSQGFTKSRSVYSSPEVHSDSESEVGNPENSSQRSQLKRLKKEKDEWMQKYFSLLTAQEIKDRLIAETLETVESEIHKLNGKVLELQRDKQTLSLQAKKMREEMHVQEAKSESVQIQWKRDKEEWKKAITLERRTCAQELATIATQFLKIKKQFQRYRTTADPKQAVLTRKVTDLEGKNKQFQKENAELKRVVGKLQKELRHLYSSAYRSSLSPGRISASNSAPNSKRSLSRGKSSRKQSQEQRDQSPEKEESIEGMMANVEARLHRAKDLVLEEGLPSESP